MKHIAFYDTYKRTTNSLVLSVLFHLFIIFSVTFSYQILSTPKNSLEITLVNLSDNKRINAADILAQASKEGSGVHNETIQVTIANTPIEDDKLRVALQNATDPKIVSDKAQFEEDEKEASERKHQELLVTLAVSSQTTYEQQPLSEMLLTETPLFINNIVYNTETISSLQSRIDTEQKLRAELLNVRRPISANTTYSNEAQYIFNWIKRIEEIAIQAYPQEAIERDIWGHLRMRVVLRHDGVLSYLDITRSSGFEVLDSAAINIVNAASPFEPFPEDLASQYNYIEIIRTWYFYKDEVFTSSNDIIEGDSRAYTPIRSTFPVHE